MKNKVFFFTSSLYTHDRGRGGIAELLHQLIPELDVNCKNISDIHVISLFGEVEENTQFQVEVIQTKFEHQSDFNFLKKMKFWLVSSVYLLKFIFKNYNELKSAKLISTSPGPTFFLSLFFKENLIWENVSFFSKRKYIDFFRLLICKLSSSTLIVPTRHERDMFLKKMFMPNVIYIPDWHDPMIVPSKRNSDSEVLKLMAAGMLEHRKGFDLLLMALQKIDKDILNSIHLSIYGDGPQREQLKLFIKENNLSSNVSLRGFSRELNKEYHHFDCFILSSRYEGFPLVMVNALASGMPVIAFDCKTGPSDIITPKNGILVENCNVKQLSHAIVNFYENRKESFLFEDCVASSSDYELSSITKSWASLLE